MVEVIGLVLMVFVVIYLFFLFQPPKHTSSKYVDVTSEAENILITAPPIPQPNQQPQQAIYTDNVSSSELDTRESFVAAIWGADNQPETNPPSPSPTSETITPTPASTFSPSYNSPHSFPPPPEMTPVPIMAFIPGYNPQPPEMTQPPPITFIPGFNPPPAPSPSPTVVPGYTQPAPVAEESPSVAPFTPSPSWTQQCTPTPTSTGSGPGPGPIPGESEEESPPPPPTCTPGKCIPTPLYPCGPLPVKEARICPHPSPSPAANQAYKCDRGGCYLHRRTSPYPTPLPSGYYPDQSSCKSTCGKCKEGKLNCNHWTRPCGPLPIGRHVCPKPTITPSPPPPIPSPTYSPTPTNTPPPTCVPPTYTPPGPGPPITTTPSGPPITTTPSGPPITTTPSGPPITTTPSGPPITTTPSGPPITTTPSGPPITTTPSGPSPSPGPGGYYEGDGIASNTYYTANESKGIGACGGCQWPPKTGSYSELFYHIQQVVGKDWTLAATSEAMMAPYCPKSVGMGCTGRANPSGPTANAPCGSCWRLTQGGKSINVYVADACPCGNKSSCPSTAGGADNSPHCRAKPGEINSRGTYNHFDIWNGNKFGFASDGKVTFKSIRCPANLKHIMKQACCDIYWAGQGCPDMCGHGYKCP